MNKIITLLLLFATITSFSQIKTGQKVPPYIFKDILNGDKKPFDISTQGKPLILEFWATWCAPCIPAMKKLEDYQNKFGKQLEILTISSDKLNSLLRYIDNTKTSLKIAHDSMHIAIFDYRHIPHTILVDKNGFVKAITSPDQLTEKIIADFVAGKEIEIIKKQDNPTNLGLFKEFKNDFYQYTLTAENINLKFKNEIKRNQDNEPISLEFNNVSIYRLLTDIYELTTAARLDVNKDSISKNKYCFKLEQSAGYSKNILDNAKEILNEISGFKARLIEKTVDSLYTLQVIDSTMLPNISFNEKYSTEGGGTYFKGIKISSNDLIMYLEDITFLPVKDKTGINFVFDMELNWSYENPKTLNEELKKYGLKLKKSNVPEKIVMLEIK
ncbi:MAG: thioredoxin [Bacteroidetes bacterium]|nr:MAG: thioredoxin [Bacteroidota bacterium]